MIKEVRRRFRHPWLAVGPEGGSGGHGMRPSSDEVRLLLVRRLQRSAVSRFLTFELDEEDDDAHSFCLALRGKSCSFDVAIGPLISLIDFDWERIWFVTEGYRDHMAHQDLQEEIVYGGPIEGKTPAEVLDLIYEMVCILAGAREVFHDEIRPEEKWDTIDFSEFDDCSYDVYVRDDHSAPYARRFANITFYVNCDAREAEGLGADETGAVASPGEESPPTGAREGGGPKDEPPAPVEGAPADAWAAWGTCRWRIDPGGTLWIAPVPGQTRGDAGGPSEERVPWRRRRGEVRAVRVVGTVRLGGDATGLFCGMSRCERMDLAGLDTSRVTTMSRMFCYCSSLAALDLSGWDSSGVRDMSDMFQSCSSLTSLDTSGWDTSAVRDMSGMFCDCSSLAALDLSGWDSSVVTTMYGMFCGMLRCERLDLAGLDTSRVTDMSRLFDDCGSLAALDISGWDTSAVRDMRRMFWGCRSLASLDASAWDTSQVTDMERAFERCSSLASLDVSGWDTSRVRSLRCTFSGCVSLAALDVSAWDTSQAEDLRGMFCGCSSLSFLDLSGWDMSGALDVSEMFRSCTGLSGVRLGVRFSFRPHEPSRSVWLARLPDPPAGPPYGGGWAMEGGSPAMGATELATRYGPALAGTWVWARGRD